MTFPKTFLLEQHIQEFHEKRRPFECEVCQKKFFRIKHLQVHNTSTYHKKRVAWSEKGNKENLAPKYWTKNSPKKSSSKPSVTEVFTKESNQEKSGNVLNEKNDDEQNSTKENISKETIDFPNLEMDEKASKNLKENKFENIDTYLSQMNQTDESTKAIETGIFL